MRRTILACVVVALVAGATTATAQSLITSKDIKDGTIRNRDVAKNQVSLNRLSPGLQRLIRRATSTQQTALSQSAPAGAPGAPGAQGPRGERGERGPQGPRGANGADGMTPTAGNWGVLYRNTIGNASAELRSGPTSAWPGHESGNTPYGKGSLGLLVGSGNDKIAFGNEVDFVGDSVLDIEELGFHVFTTGENNGRGANNMPTITFEIDPNVTGKATDYSSLVFAPNASAVNKWSGYIDATDDSAGLWGLSSGAFAGEKCYLSGSRCTWSELMELLDDGDGSDPVIGTVQITKGRDHAWQGAVDGFRYNDTVFDFEEHGVFERAAD
jgi:hypothetical protein